MLWLDFCGAVIHFHTQSVAGNISYLLGSDHLNQTTVNGPILWCKSETTKYITKTTKSTCFTLSSGVHGVSAQALGAQPTGADGVAGFWGAGPKPSGGQPVEGVILVLRQCAGDAVCGFYPGKWKHWRTTWHSMCDAAKSSRVRHITQGNLTRFWHLCLFLHSQVYTVRKLFDDRRRVCT